MPNFHYMASTSATDEQHESLYKRFYGVEIAKGFSVLSTINLDGSLMVLDFSRAGRSTPLAGTRRRRPLPFCTGLALLATAVVESHAVAMLVLVVVDEFVILTLILLQSLLSAASRHHQRWLLSLTVCVPHGVMVTLTLSLDAVHLLRFATYRRVTVPLRAPSESCFAGLAGCTRCEVVAVDILSRPSPGTMSYTDAVAPWLPTTVLKQSEAITGRYH